MYDFIDNLQRRSFSYSKYKTSTLKTSCSPQNQVLTKILSSMPAYKLEKIYEIKKKNMKQLVAKKKIAVLPKAHSPLQSKTVESDDEYYIGMEKPKYRFRKQEEVEKILRNRPLSKTPEQVLILTERNRKSTYQVEKRMNLYFEGIPIKKDSNIIEARRNIFNVNQYYHAHYNNLATGIWNNKEVKRIEQNFNRKVQRLMFQ